MQGRQQARENKWLGQKPEHLSVQANLVFFYYKDLPQAEGFYKDILGLKPVLDTSGGGG